MSQFTKCPNCRSKANTGKFFPIFECKKCRKLYCYICDGSAEGKKCPSCGTREYVTAGNCYPE